MNIAVNWDNNDKTILRYTLSGDWDWNDFYDALERQTAHCTGADHHVCLLIDLLSVTRVPSDAILHLKRATELASAVTGLIVLIASNAEAQTMYNLFITIYRSVGYKFRLVASDEEAYAACNSLSEVP